MKTFLFMQVTIPGSEQFIKLVDIRYNPLMSIQRQIRGVIAAALTPLKADYSPALEAWPEFLSYLAGRGCHGVLLMGTTGEGPSFSPEERIQIVKAVLPVRNEVPEFQILVGTGTPSLEETIVINRAVFDLGVDGVVVLPPYYYRKVSEAGLFEWYAQVIRRSVPVGSAILIYHIPGLTGVTFNLDLIERLLGSFPDHRIGIKDSTTDPDIARELGKRFGRELLTFSGTDSLFDLALEHSASGCITAMSNLRSPDLRRVWEARCADKIDQQARLRLEKARKLMDRYPPNPPLYKGLLHCIHHFPLWMVRPPLCPVDKERIELILTEARQEVEGFEE